MPYLGDGKLVRVRPDAHSAAKIAAAIIAEQLEEGITMEDWCSAVSIQASKAVRYGGSGKTLAVDDLVALATKYAKEREKERGQNASMSPPRRRSK